MPKVEKMLNWSSEGEAACSKRMIARLNSKLKSIEGRIVPLKNSEEWKRGHPLSKNFDGKNFRYAKKFKKINEIEGREYMFILRDENGQPLLKRPMTWSKAKDLNYNLKSKAWNWEIIPF
jgi:hypothetical protein